MAFHDFNSNEIICLLGDPSFCASGGTYKQPDRGNKINGGKNMTDFQRGHKDL